MLKGNRIVVFIPSGRKRVQSILIDNLRRFPEIDEVQIWMNVDEKGQEDDEAWLRTLPAQWDKCKLYELPADQKRMVPKQYNTGKFYLYTQDPKTIYFRFDDDIVYVDDNYFKNMVNCRLAYPKPPIICGNIWNNAICSFLHQADKNISLEHGVVESAFCMDPVGWQSGMFAEYIHKVLLAHIEEGTTKSLYLDNYKLENTRFSISNFCFTGDAMRGMRPLIDDEEIWLTERHPERTGVSNIICGDALVSHYSFFAQRTHLDTTDILDQYRKVAKKLLSDSYYKMLGQAPA